MPVRTAAEQMIVQAAVIQTVAQPCSARRGRGHQRPLMNLWPPMPSSERGTGLAPQTLCLTGLRRHADPVAGGKTTAVRSPYAGYRFPAGTAGRGSETDCGAAGAD